MIKRTYICKRTNMPVEITSLNAIDHANAISEYENRFDTKLVELREAV